MAYPEDLPGEAFSLLGSVPVTRESLGGPQDDGSHTFGEYRLAERKIIIDPGLDPQRAWKTFFHEVTHLALDDSGVHYMLSAKLEEAVCDAVGGWLAGALKAGLLQVTTDRPTRRSSGNTDPSA